MAVAVFPSLFLKKSSNPIKLCKLYRFFRLARIEKLVKELGNLFRAEAGDPNAASHQTLFDAADPLFYLGAVLCEGLGVLLDLFRLIFLFRKKAHRILVGDDRRAVWNDHKEAF